MSAEYVPTPVPPAPAGWAKTTRDLHDEMARGLRDSVGFPEHAWAMDYERSLLPPGTRFPRFGEIYRAKQPVPLTLYLSWHSPVTTDAAFTLPTGCEVRIETEGGERPLAVNALPVNYKAVEKAALPLWTRWRPDYAGYHLTLDTTLLNSAFEFVSATTSTSDNKETPP